MWPQVTKYFTFNYDKNIVELFKPIYIVLSLTGLFPYNIEFPKGRHDTRVTQKPLPLNSFGAAIMFAFLCFYFTHRIQASMIVNNLASNSVSNITNNIDLSITILCAIVIYSCSFRNATNYVKILSDIAFCWADLSHVNVNSILKYLHELFIYPATAWLVVFPIVQAAIIITGVENVYIQVMLFAFAEIMPSSIVAFYSVMVLLAVGLLKNIEQHCQIVVATNHQRTRNLGKVNVQVDCWIHIGQLEQAYEKTIDIKEDINNALQAPILLIIIQCFHSILNSSHSLYRAVMVLNQIHPSMIIHHSFLVLYSLSKVYALTFTGSLLKGEEFNIGQTLHNISTENQDNRMLMEIGTSLPGLVIGLEMCRSPELFPICMESEHSRELFPYKMREITERHITKLIQHFATLMSFRKPTIAVYDYFPLDATFLYGVIATVVTYLVILVQFDTV